MPIVQNPGNPTTKKCLPSRTLSIGATRGMSNGSKIHIIFLKVCFHNNNSHAHSAHSRKSNYERVPALKNTFNQGRLANV